MYKFFSFFINFINSYTQYITYIHSIYSLKNERMMRCCDGVDRACVTSPPPFTESREKVGEGGEVCGPCGRGTNKAGDGEIRRVIYDLGREKWSRQVIRKIRTD
jgi:hypothetical protein